MSKNKDVVEQWKNNIQEKSEKLLSDLIANTECPEEGATVLANLLAFMIAVFKKRGDDELGKKLIQWCETRVTQIVEHKKETDKNV